MEHIDELRMRLAEVKFQKYQLERIRRLWSWPEVCVYTRLKDDIFEIESELDELKEQGIA